MTTDSAPRILVTESDFSVGNEHQRLIENNPQQGAVVCFTGLVREMAGDVSLTALHLEHYPGMTERCLLDIAQTAQQRFGLDRTTIIHRVGTLALNAQIVFVGVTSAHRQAAFDGANFIMDYLKTQAPFWKKEIHTQGHSWVDAKETDNLAARRWNQSE